MQFYQFDDDDDDDDGIVDIVVSDSLYVICLQRLCSHCGNHFCSRCCNYKVTRSMFGATGKATAFSGSVGFRLTDMHVLAIQNVMVNSYCLK